MRKNFVLILFLLMSQNLFADDLSLYEQKLIENVKGVFDMEKGPVLDLPVCATPVFLEVHAAKDKLSPQAKKILKPYTSRPGEDWDPHQTLDSPKGHFKIHYTTTGLDSVYHKDVDKDGNGVPDYVDSCAKILDYVWFLEVDSLRYKTPPSDSFYPPDMDNGGDGKYDVYLLNMKTGYYGYTQQESLYLSSDRSKTSYIALRTDYSHYLDLYKNVYEPLSATAAHEFFHAIHFGYDAFEYEYREREDKPYWMEISAVWMEDQVFDKINDYINYLPWFYNYPWLSLKSFSRDPYDKPRYYHSYASCVWAIFLSERFEKDIIRKIWEGCGEIKGDNAIEATSEVLKSDPYLSSFDDAFREFTVWNYFTAERARTEEFYSEGDLFYGPDGKPIYVAVNTIHREYPVAVDAILYPPENLGSNYVVFKPQSSRGGLKVEFTGKTGTWKVSAVGYNPLHSDTSKLELLEFNINPSTQNGAAEVYDWALYSEIVMIPAADTVNSDESFFYQYSGEYDSSLHGEQPLPLSDLIYQNFPNPFIIESSDSYTYFRFTLSNPSRVRIDIFTSSGELVKTIHPKQVYPIGDYNEKNSIFFWDGRNASGESVSSGVYLYHVKTKNASVVKKMVVLR